jgi:NADH:ubiquinone oxidoreductase subunit 6 (subunit J)
MKITIRDAIAILMLLMGIVFVIFVFSVQTKSDFPEGVKPSIDKLSMAILSGFCFLSSSIIIAIGNKNSREK